MIRVFVQKNDEKIVSMKVKGHADSGPYGEDLVCAAVSSIVFGLANALDTMDCKATIETGDNYFCFTVKEDEMSQCIMHVGLIQLQTVAESNGKFIKIDTEV